LQDKQRLIELQNKIVHCLASAVQERWDFLVVNFEREEIDGERTQDTLAIAFSQASGNWKRISVVAPYKCCGLLIQLSELMAMDGGSTWGSCTLEVDSKGEYRYSFCYEAPKRLNGIMDDEALLKTYAPQPF
jgi:hypothetical protein